MDAESESIEMIANSSYEASTTALSTIAEDDSVYLDTKHCPADSIVVDLRNYPEYLMANFLYSTTDKIMISNVFPVIMTIGLLGNCAFLWTLVRVRQMRTLTNVYLANLAVADLIFVVVQSVNFFYKFIWSSEFQDGAPWKYAASCSVLQIAIYLPLFASICLVTLVSIERFLAICFPLKHRMVNTKSRTIKLIVCTWLIALSFTALQVPQDAYFIRYCIFWPPNWQHRLPSVITKCNTLKNEFLDVGTIVQFVPFFAALILNTILYVLIIFRLSQRDIGDKHDKGDSQAQKQATQVRNAVARMLIINGIAFFLCLTPFQFYNLYILVVRKTNERYLGQENEYIISWVGRCLTVLNSAVNPFIYSVTNARYRRAFVSAIGCSPKRGNVSEMTTSVTAVSRNNETRM